jgi:branched-chain amino acid transport system ATP-binding protein
MMSRPQLLFLDELSFGLSLKLVNMVFETIQEIPSEDVTIFLVEQNANKALENSDVGYVINMGKNSFKDTSENLLPNEEVRMSYLGGRAEQTTSEV